MVSAMDEEQQNGQASLIRGEQRPEQPETGQSTPEQAKAQTGQAAAQARRVGFGLSRTAGGGVSRRTKDMHRRAALEYAKCGNKAEALRRAGASPVTARSKQKRTFDRIARDPDAARLLQRGQITEARMAAKLSMLLDAERKTVDGDGCVVSVPDNAVQLRAAELCLRLGKYIKDGEDPSAVLVVVMQQIVPLVMPFVPEDRRPALAAAVQAYGQAR